MLVVNQWYFLNILIQFLRSPQAVWPSASPSVSLPLIRVQNRYLSSRSQLKHSQAGFYLNFPQINSPLEQNNLAQKSDFWGSCLYIN